MFQTHFMIYFSFIYHYYAYALLHSHFEILQWYRSIVLAQPVSFSHYAIRRKREEEDHNYEENYFYLITFQIWEEPLQGG